MTRSWELWGPQDRQVKACRTTSQPVLRTASRNASERRRRDRVGPWSRGACSLSPFQSFDSRSTSIPVVTFGLHLRCN